MKQRKQANVLVVILAGGQSSRLFPFNKVLADLTGSGKSLLQQAHDRVKRVASKRIYALTVREMVAPIRRQLKLPASHVFVDPVRRGTWPALLWAMAHLRRQDPQAVLAVLTGDHVIQGDRAFLQAFREALRLAETKPGIVMLGIPPTSDPQVWQGFGCFRTDASGRVVEFREKPTIQEAERMIQAGGWRWNSGMFFFRIASAEAALQRFQPEMHRVYSELVRYIDSGQKAEAAFLFGDFPEKIPHPLDPGRSVDNSIDYAIMTPLVAGIQTDLAAYATKDVRFRWLDLGQWNALREVLKADRQGNIRIGKTFLRGQTRDCILVAEAGRRIDIENVEDLVIALAGRTALVCSAAQLSRMKEAAQEAAKHPDRLVMEHDVTDCDIQATGGRVIAIGVAGLSIRLSGRRLVVEVKPGFIR